MSAWEDKLQWKATASGWSRVALLWFLCLRQGQGEKVRSYGINTQGRSLWGLGAVSDSEDKGSSRGSEMEFPHFLLFVLNHKAIRWDPENPQAQSFPLNTQCTEAGEQENGVQEGPRNPQSWGGRWLSFALFHLSLWAKYILRCPEVVYQLNPSPHLISLLRGMDPKEVPPFARQRNRWEDERLGSLKGTRLSCLRTRRKEMKEMWKPFPLGRKTYMTNGDCYWVLS